MNINPITHPDLHNRHHSHGHANHCSPPSPPHCKWVATFITCCVEAVDCAAEIFIVTATIAFLARLILCSTVVANDIY